MSGNNDTLLINSTIPTSTLIVVLGYIRVNIINQFPLIITVLGLIGFLGNTFTFLQPNLRNNSFCIYTLCGSLIDIINILINLFPSYINQVLTTSTSLRCKLYIFGLVFLPQLSVDLLIMSLIDRYACTYGLTSPMRYLLKRKTVPCLIGITVIITCILSLYSPIVNDVTPNFGCGSTNPMLNGLLYILLHGIITPGIMLVIVLFTYRRFKQSRQRVGATGVLSTNRYRNQFIATGFAQAFVASFLALQWIITYWYFIATQYKTKNAEEWAINIFALALTNNLYYFINAKSFYLSTLTSHLFRKTFIKALRKLLSRRLYWR